MSQFIVAGMRELPFIGRAEYVRVDKATIQKWKDDFPDQEITKVIIEDTMTGKKIRSPFQPIKNENLMGKGVIQLPEKAQQLLNTKNGALVVVRPLVN